MPIAESITNHVTGSPTPITPILFLDIDGVLHPANAVYLTALGTPGGNRLFRWAPILLELLQKHPQVRIVISSAWRYIWEYGELLGYLPEALRPYIIGTTRPTEPRRFEAIFEYIGQFKLTKYAILDDAAAEFPLEFPGFIWCPPRKGLSDGKTLELLNNFLELITNGTV